MEIKVREEHRWLHQLEGEWRFDGVSLLAPDSDRDTVSGRERVRRLGEFWVVAESESGIGGALAHSVMTLGFDIFSARFVGTWAGSMMPALWVYSGYLDNTRRVLTLETEGPSFEKQDRTVKYRDLVTVVDTDTRRLQSFALMENGRWREFMNLRYLRDG